ncbi:MAG: translation elongation factor Ts [Microscillaceae bacterium]|jgi:elongation factor Ts|nr:translation elongation factor Ts [Microscillaceae bacterium]
MAITAQDVNKLRQITGAGMMDCKKALTEANGDFEEAITILRKKGQKVSANRADRETTEGAVFIYTNEAATEGMIIALNCETDFVAKNDDFQNLGKQILDLVVSNRPAGLEDLNALKVDERTVAEYITEYVGKIGEKIEISAYFHVKGEKVASYLHSNSKVGVLAAFTGVGSADINEVGKDVTMQIAAMKPISIDKDDVDSSVIEREIEIGKEQARQEGKPEAMLEKIALGKLNKFYQESTLLNQQFVKDNNKTIRQLLEETNNGLTVSEFKRVSIG